MKAQIRKLDEIARKDSRLCIGLMSGTSLDGLDVALVQITGAGSKTRISLKEYTTVAFCETEKERIRSVFAKDTVDFKLLTALNPWVAQLHARCILQCLSSWKVAPQEVDCLASHGQTVMHAPRRVHGFADLPNATLQIGDGDHLAVATGIITVSDFRQKHVAAGGEGAPLALYGDYLLFSSDQEDRILINCGGIANFTFLSKSLKATEAFATDAGPGNTLLDAFTREYFPGHSFDEDARFAKRGTVHSDLLASLKSHPFFLEALPKSTGPEVFSKQYVRDAQAQSGTQAISPEDLLATLVEFSADTLANTVNQALGERAISSAGVYVSGGGAHNPLLMSSLKSKVHGTVHMLDVLGVPGDAKEALLFAVLANETLAGEGVDFGSREGIPSVSMGKISLY